jgi:hypothetical protein
MIANEYTSVNKLYEDKTEDGLVDDKDLTKLEANKISPMWEVEEVLKKYGGDDDKISILEYGQWYRDKWNDSDVCTKKEIAAGGPKRVDKCSIDADSKMTSCHNGPPSYDLKNSLCPRAYESCASVSTARNGPFY